MPGLINVKKGLSENPGSVASSERQISDNIDGSILRDVQADNTL